MENEKSIDLNNYEWVLLEDLSVEELRNIYLETRWTCLKCATEFKGLECPTCGERINDPDFLGQAIGYPKNVSEVKDP
jgi:tRNA(Ile2) C34 agmatinyltransferase TiaS